jgi:YidC/Oxa1 family membrane protein insertase
MFTTLIVQPIFNLLVFIYAILPGHNFGLAIILFTILVRLLMWPLVKKQLHNAKAMRKLQPELKRIKKAAGGNRTKESAMVMELYKERGINPFGQIGLVILQLPILLGLYAGLSRIIKDPNQLVSFSYSYLQDLGWMKQVAENISRFDETLFGVVDLTRSAIGSSGGVYWPAMLLVIGSAVSQYFQSKQLMPNDKNARKLRDILKGASTSGEKADQAEVNAAVGRSTRFLIPAMIFFFTVNIASALSLYWLVSGLVAIVQQKKILGDDEEELENTADTTSKSKKEVIEGEVISVKSKTKSKKSKSSAKKGKKSRRRR